MAKNRAVVTLNLEGAQQVAASLSVIQDAFAAMSDAATSSVAKLNSAVGNIQNQILGTGDASEKAAETTKKGFGKIKSTVDSDVNAISASIFKFRDNVNKSFGPVVNSIAKVFRELARIRTAFFILVTFLGIRPALRFFKDLLDESSASVRAMNKIEEKYSIIKNQLSTAIAPYLLPVFDSLIKKVITLLDIVQNSGFRQVFTSYFGVLLSAIRSIGRTVSKVTEAIVYLLDEVLQDSPEIILAFGYAGQAAFTGMYNTYQILKGVITGGSKGFQDAVDRSNNAIDALNETFENAKRNLASLKASGATIVVRATAATAFSADEDIKVMLAHWEKLFQEGSEKLKQILLNGLTLEGVNETALDKFFQGFNEKIIDTIQAAKVLGAAVKDAFEKGLSDSFLKIMELRFNKFKDIIVSTLESLKRALADFLASAAIKGFFGDALPYLVGIARGVGTSSVAPVSSANLGPVNPPGPYSPPPGPGYASGFPALTSGGNTRTAPNVTFNVNTIDATSFDGYLKKNKGTIRDIMNSAVSGEDSTTRFNFGQG